MGSLLVVTYKNLIILLQSMNLTSMEVFNMFLRWPKGQVFTSTEHDFCFSNQTEDYLLIRVFGPSNRIPDDKQTLVSRTHTHTLASNVRKIYFRQMHFMPFPL